MVKVGGIVLSRRLILVVNNVLREEVLFGYFRVG